MLFQLLTAVKHLNENDSYHGDIFPRFIYLSPRNSKYPWS
jgi:hypothetical protein